MVDDIAGGGHTMAAVQGALKAEGVVDASYAALVCSMTCRATLQGFPLYSPMISATGQAALPWITRGELSVDGDTYVFGRSDDPFAFSVARRQAEFIVRRLSGRKVG